MALTFSVVGMFIPAQYHHEGITLTVEAPLPQEGEFALLWPRTAPQIGEELSLLFRGDIPLTVRGGENTARTFTAWQVDVLPDTLRLRPQLQREETTGDVDTGHVYTPWDKSPPSPWANR